MQFPPDTSYPYQWILFDEILHHDFSNCPQVFCFLRVAMETLPIINYTTSMNDRAGFVFSGPNGGSNITTLPENQPPNSETYRAYNSGEIPLAGAPQSDFPAPNYNIALFNQQSIWIKGVDTAEVSNHVPIDIIIQNCVFNGNGKGNGYHFFGMGPIPNIERIGAGIVFSYRIPESSTITITNNLFNGVAPSSTMDGRTAPNQQGSMMFNALFPNSACSLCFSTFIVEDNVTINVGSTNSTCHAPATRRTLRHCGSFHGQRSLGAVHLQQCVCLKLCPHRPAGCSDVRWGVQHYLQQ